MPHNDGITVVASGGLGNQLFILAAGLEAAINLDCPLYIDCRHYHGKALRAFELNLLPLHLAPVPIKIVNNSPNQATFAARARARLFPVIAPSKFYIEPRGQVSTVIKRPNRGSEMRGYFQSHVYWPNAVSEVLKLLASSEAFKLARNGQKGEPIPDLSVQVRQGDYLLPTVRDLYGVCSEEYFERAYKVMSDITKINLTKIHSDSPDNVEKLLSKLPKGTQIERTHFASSLAALVDFSSAQSFIISNSSFGWWGASLGQFVAENTYSSYVVAPRPWVLNKELADTTDLLPLHWLTLDNRRRFENS